MAINVAFDLNYNENLTLALIQGPQAGNFVTYSDFVTNLLLKAEVTKFLFLVAIV